MRVKNKIIFCIFIFSMFTLIVFDDYIFGLGFFYKLGGVDFENKPILSMVHVFLAYALAGYLCLKMWWEDD